MVDSMVDSVSEADELEDAASSGRASPPATISGYIY